MKVLFIGGTGIISSASSQLAVDKGIDLYLLNRGKTSSRPVPDGANVLVADINDISAVKNALGNHKFDAVVDWIAFTPDQVERDIDLFRNITDQYIFISSASAYHKPIRSLPITESTPLYNPYWEYSRNKIACEERLMREYRETGFPFTVVRPSHTYDKTLLPFQERWNDVYRMRQGMPVIVHGDGTSLWTLTHHRDFAVAFVGLLGNHRALGEAYHITSDEVLTWDQIYRTVGRAAGVKDIDIVHVPSELLRAYDKPRGDGLVGDKAHSVIFDNSKVKNLVPEYKAVIPFWQGAQEVIDWYDANPENKLIEPEINVLMDRIIAAQRGAWPKEQV